MITKPIYVGFCVLGRPKLKMSEWYCGKILPYFGKYTAETHFMDTNSITNSFDPITSWKDDLKQFTEDLELKELGSTHELYSKGNKNIIQKNWKFKQPSKTEVNEAVFKGVNPLLLQSHQKS